MNKALSKKLEQAARKYSKKTTLGLKDSYIKGGEFIDKNSDKQYTEKDLYQAVNEILISFADKHNTPINSIHIKKYFNTYLKKSCTLDLV